MHHNRPFIMFTIALLLFAISPFLLAEGMFFDGLDYAAISHNLAQGIGSFWSLKMSETLFSQFYGHPPLAFGLQALFYNCFGNSLYLDKLYSVTTFLLTGLLMTGIWKTLGKKIATAWIPLLLWLCFPLVLWALPNNLLENTMSIFVTASVWCYLLYKKQNDGYWLLTAGFMVCLAFFSKGVTGLFTLVMPCVYVILFKEKFWNIIKETGLILMGLLVPCLILFILIPESYLYIVKYIQEQVLNASQTWITVDTRFYIVLQLLLNSIPHLTVLFILFLYNWRCESKILFQTYRTDRKMFWFLMITALNGVLPIMISLKQSNFYMLASFPLFAVAWACILEPPLQQFINRISVKTTQILKIVSLLLILGGVGSIIGHYGTISQDRQLLTDIHQLLPHIPEHTTIGIDKSMFEEWRLYPYFARYKNISLDCDHEHDFLMVRDSTMLKNYHHTYILKWRTPTLLLYVKAP